MPYDGDKADPALVARYEALGKLPQNTFGKALWDFDKKNGYPFPGDPDALNAAFATPHDSTHVISGYDTSYRGEILVSTFTAAMHPINPDGRPHPAGDLQRPSRRQVQRRGDAGTRGGLDPDEFWHAWARGRDMTVDIFDRRSLADVAWDWTSSATSRNAAALDLERHAAPELTGV